MDLGLAGRAFVVTGGSRGLGYVGVAADLAGGDTPAELVEACVGAYGRLDGALVSVGGPPPGPAMGLSDEQ